MCERVKKLKLTLRRKFIKNFKQENLRENMRKFSDSKNNSFLKKKTTDVYLKKQKNIYEFYSRTFRILFHDLSIAAAATTTHSHNTHNICEIKWQLMITNWREWHENVRWWYFWKKFHTLTCSSSWTWLATNLHHTNSNFPLFLFFFVSDSRANEMFTFL